MLKLGVLGGTFNPIHVGHLIVAQYVLEEYNLDRIVFIPSGDPPHKDPRDIVSGIHRENMIRHAIEFNEKFDVSNIELKREGTTYTYDTLIELKKIYPYAQINFIVGYDTFLDMKNWHRTKEVMQLAKFIVVNRNSKTKDMEEYLKSFTNEFGGLVDIIEIPNIEISSSEIRKRKEHGKNIIYMVTNEVDKYIIENNLYRGDLVQ